MKAFVDFMRAENALTEVKALCTNIDTAKILNQEVATEIAYVKFLVNPRSTTSEKLAELKTKYSTDTELTTYLIDPKCFVLGPGGESDVATCQVILRKFSKL